MRSCGPAPVLMMESYSLEDSMGAGVRSHSRARDAFLPLTAIIKRKRRLDRRLVSEEKALDFSFSFLFFNRMTIKKGNGR